jgi:hypothetical protein
MHYEEAQSFYRITDQELRDMRILMDKKFKKSVDWYPEVLVARAIEFYYPGLKVTHDGPYLYID